MKRIISYSFPRKCSKVMASSMWNKMNRNKQLKKSLRRSSPRAKVVLMARSIWKTTNNL